MPLRRRRLPSSVVTPQAGVALGPTWKDRYGIPRSPFSESPLLAKQASFRIHFQIHISTVTTTSTSTSARQDFQLPILARNSPRTRCFAAPQTHRMGIAKPRVGSRMEDRKPRSGRCAKTGTRVRGEERAPGASESHLVFTFCRVVVRSLHSTSRFPFPSERLSSSLTIGSCDRVLGFFLPRIPVILKAD